MNQLIPILADRAPALVAALGERASYRFFEFFSARIKYPNTRRAYMRAVHELRRATMRRPYHSGFGSSSDAKASFTPPSSLMN
jgi:hypothetical protein